MPEASAVTPLKALFRFPFQGTNWRNHFLIGSALNLAAAFVPILPSIFVYGYVLRIMRRAIEGGDLELPAWDDWGKLGADGLRLMLVSLVYLLPGLLVILAGWTIYMVASFSSPLVMATAGEQGEGAAVLMAMLSFFGSFVILMLCMLLGSLLLLLGSIPLPAALAHFVARDQVAAAFRVREWWPMLRANRLGYFAAWVVMFGLVTVLYLAVMFAYYSVVLCCFIPVLAAPLTFYAALIGGVLFAQIYRESKSMLAAVEPLPAG
jgi:hypothetical protein